MNAKRRLWNKEDDKYIINNWLNLSKEDIGKVLNRTSFAVKRRANLLGVKKQEPYSNWTKWEENYIIEHFSADQKELIIARLNRTWMAIRNKAKKLGVNRESRSHFVEGINHYFFDTWSEEMAYILGFIAADGNINKLKYKLGIKLSIKDEQHLIKIRNILAPKQPLRYYINKKNKKYVSLEISSKYMCSSLIKLGIVPKKSLILKFPTVPEQFIKDFIRGDFDGDGCISKDSNSGYWQMNFLGTYDLLTSISQHINKNTNSGHRLPRLLKSNIHIIKYAMYDSIKLCNYMYKDATIYLDRKYEKFQQLLNERN